MTCAKILIVDDDADERLFMKSVLISHGYAVLEAADGIEALESVQGDHPDVILLDLEMPRMDGFETCRRLKEDPRTRLIPVVVVTSLEGIPEKLLALEAGANEFLNKPVSPIELRTRVRSLVALKQFTDELEHAEAILAAITRVVDQRDRYTGGHCERVAAMAVRIAGGFGLPADRMRELRLGALLHDLGKIAIPDAVLRKSGSLTPEEYEIMKTHPRVGADLCLPLQSLKRVIPIIRSHHERLDGSGYPDGLSGTQIPLEVRIVSVSDVYDALTTDRPYRAAFPPARSIDMLRSEVEKGWWDGGVVEELALAVGVHSQQRGLVQLS